MTWFREIEGWTIVSEPQDSLHLTRKLTLPLFSCHLVETSVNPGKLRTTALRSVRMHSVLHPGTARRSLDAELSERRTSESVKRRERRASTKGAERFFDELELKFDLMRLRKLRAGLQREAACLTQKEELLKANLLNVAGPGRWRRILSTKAYLFWIGAKRQALADRQRWFLPLEGDLEFALRLRNIHPSKWDRGSRDA